jgi:hypothetical protein
VVSAQASGDPARIRDALRSYGQSLGDDKAVNPDFRLVNTMAGLMVRSIADRYWTENTGVRMADDSGYSTFWDAAADDGLGDLGVDLFDDSAAPESDTPAEDDMSEPSE